MHDLLIQFDLNVLRLHKSRIVLEVAGFPTDIKGDLKKVTLLDKQCVRGDRLRTVPTDKEFFVCGLRLCRESRSMGWR